MRDIQDETRLILVATCADCAFLVESMESMESGMPSVSEGLWCSAISDPRPLQVDNKAFHPWRSKPPAWCPLRESDRIVQLRLEGDPPEHPEHPEHAAAGSKERSARHTQSITGKLSNEYEDKDDDERFRVLTRIQIAECLRDGLQAPPRLQRAHQAIPAEGKQEPIAWETMEALQRAGLVRRTWDSVSSGWVLTHAGLAVWQARANTDKEQP